MRLLNSDAVSWSLPLVPLDAWERMSVDVAPSLHDAAIVRAVERLAAGRPVLLRAFDRTEAGGVHYVAGLLDRLKGEFSLVTPAVAGERQPPAGRIAAGALLPTACHLAEIVLAIYVRCGVEPPSLTVRSRQEVQVIASNVGPTLSLVDVPLMIDPPYTNALVFHTQSPSFSPARFVTDWYRALAQSRADKLSLRHTMLLRPVGGANCSRDYQPPDKSTVNFHVLSTEAARQPSDFRLLHLGRVSDWSSGTSANQTKHVAIRDMATTDLRCAA